MAFKYSDCLDRGLIRRIPPSEDNAVRSIKKADKWLKDSVTTLKSKSYDSSVLASYMAMFHSARAILFRDGFREKSHACIARYLEEVYVKTGKLEKKWIELLDHHREVRHNDQYSLDFFSTKEDAVHALESAEKFCSRMKGLIPFVK